MSQRSPWWLAALALAASCNPTVTKDEPVTVSAATLALFQPDTAEPCKSVLPFPSDLAKDPATGRLNLPFCPEDSADQTNMKRGLRTLDGYSLSTAIYTRFSGALDEASIASAVAVFNAATGAPVTVGTRFDTASNTLYIQPAAPLAEATKYLVAITTDLKDPKGGAVSSDKIFVFAKSREPLIDQWGYSRFASLSDADANGLEALRQGFAPLFDGLANLGLERSKIAVAWAFTTQTVHASLPLLGQVVAGGAKFTFENRIPAAKHGLIAAAGIPATALCDVHSGRVSLRSLLTPTGTFGVDANGAPVVGTEVADYLLVTPNPDPVGDPGCTKSPAWKADKLVVFAHGLGRCKNDVLALANGFAAAGYAVLAVDGPFAGARSLTTLGDQDLDGCQDQPATPEFIAAPGQSTNPFVIRDHLREWALELSQIAAAAKAAPAALVGGTSTTPASAVAVVGHSWGGMAASLGSGLLTGVSALVVSGSSAELGAVFTAGISETVAAQLKAAGMDPTKEPGLSVLKAKTAETVAAFRWAMEPGDPLFGATPSVKALVQVVSPGAGMAEAALHGAETQRKLASAFQVKPEVLAKTTFEFANGAAPLCDDGTAVVGALLMPCIEDKTKATWPLALAKTAGMQRQAISFVASGGALVCDPDFTKPCP